MYRVGGSIYHGYIDPLLVVYWPPYPLKRLSKQVNLSLYRESQRNQFWEKYQIHDIQILKIFLKFYDNFEFFFWFFLILWNMLVLKYYENCVIFWNFWNIEIFKNKISIFILIFILFFLKFYKKKKLKFYNFFLKFWTFLKI